MQSFLLQPYPFSDNIQNKLVVCGGVGLFIALFLAVFEPFGFDELTTALKWKHAFAFGAVTFLMTAFFQILLPQFIPSLFKEEAWRSWKEIVYLLLTTVVIGAGNYGLMLLLYPQTASVAGFLRAELITLQVGIFPIVFIVFMKQMTLYRRYAAEAKAVSGNIRLVEEVKEPELFAPSVSTIRLQGDNQNEELSFLSNDLLFIASADNYVKVQLRDGEGFRSVMLRSSLKKMEEQLSAHPQFFRCHRMYLINLHVVKEVTGNAQGLKLYFSGLQDPVPVSRSLTETVRERLRQLSHSPQNA